jgi:diacylglycerol kinase family enzyme
VNQATSPDIVVIVNRGSGSGADETTCDRIAARFAARGRQATIVVAGEGAPVEAQARDAVAAGAQAIVAGGGDGTVNAVAAAAVVLGTPLRYRILPGALRVLSLG